MTETKKDIVSQNVTRHRIDNTTYVVKSFFSKSAESAILSSIGRLIQNDIAHTQ